MAADEGEDMRLCGPQLQDRSGASLCRRMTQHAECPRPPASTRAERASLAVRRRVARSQVETTVLP